jgi:Acetyltransferase (GNAT) domain
VSGRCGDADGDARLLDPATEPARVRAMFVRDDWTRRGLGRRIIAACEEAALREGFRRLVLGATLPGVPLYAACGFEPVAEIDAVLPDGVAMACVTMEKPIDRYLISVTSLNIGRYIDRMITPTTAPTAMIMIGSMIDVRFWIETSTSSS